MAVSAALAYLILKDRPPLTLRPAGVRPVPPPYWVKPPPGFPPPPPPLPVLTPQQLARREAIETGLEGKGPLPTSFRRALEGPISILRGRQRVV
jgi:hypothetical protein